MRFLGGSASGVIPTLVTLRCWRSGRRPGLVVLARSPMLSRPQRRRANFSAEISVHPPRSLSQMVLERRLNAGIADIRRI